MAEPIVNVLGIVGMKNCGDYDNNTNYEKLNVVTYQGSSYCAKGNTVGNLPTNTTYWDLLAQKGDTGDTGLQGPQGPKPVKGVDYFTEEDIEDLESTLDSDVAAEVSSQLSSLTSATPLVVSSVSGMVDTTRIYVNTTDGHWYWYDGTDWQDGGVYQSTGIENGSVDYNSLSDELKDYSQNIVNGTNIDLITLTAFEKGNINLNTGEEEVSTTAIRSGYVDVSNVRNISFVSRSSYKYKMLCYRGKSSSDFIGSTLGSEYSNTFKVFQNTNSVASIHPDIKYVRFVISDPTMSSSIIVGDQSYISALGSYTLLENQDSNNILNKPFYKWLDDSAYEITPLGWVQGIPGEGLSNRMLNSSNTRIMSSILDISNIIVGNFIINCLSGYNSRYYLYDSSFNKIQESYVWVTSYNITKPSNAKYLIIALAKTDSSNITPSDSSNVNISVTSPYSVQKIENITNNNKIDLNWEYGYLEDGFPETSYNRIRTGFIYVGKNTKIEMSSPASYYQRVSIYDLTKKYIRTTDWESTNAIIISEDCFIRIIKRKADSSNITSEEFDELIADEKIYRTFPQTILQDDINYDIPSYFVNNLNIAISNALNNIIDAGNNGDSFVFITDLHWQSNEKHSPALIKKICKNMNVDKIMCGGDLIGGGSKSSMIALMNDCINSFKDISKFYCLLGNHETNHIGSPGSSDYLSKNEVYSIIQKQSDFIMDYGKPCYFYFDNKTTKTRYICLDTGEEGTTLDSDQSSWISNTLNSMEAGYHALVFAHIVYEPKNGWFLGMTPDDFKMTSFMTAVCSILDTFNTNNNNKKVEAVIGGHIHRDCVYSTTGGIPIVLTDTDSKQTNYETSAGSGVRNSEHGTINEQCFDVITIDYVNRTIKCTRVGRGEDRVVNY